jgi:hypothetical protein
MTLLREYFSLWKLYIDMVRYDRWCEEHQDEFLAEYLNTPNLLATLT